MSSCMVEDAGGPWYVMHMGCSWLYSHARDEDKSTSHKDTWCAPRLVFAWWKM